MQLFIIFLYSFNVWSISSGFPVLISDSCKMYLFFLAISLSILLISNNLLLFSLIFCVSFCLPVTLSLSSSSSLSLSLILPIYLSIYGFILYWFMLFSFFCLLWTLFALLLMSYCGSLYQFQTILFYIKFEVLIISLWTVLLASQKFNIFCFHFHLVNYIF